MSEQRRPGKYPAELRERAVRLVREGESVYGSEWEAICAVAEMLGPSAETVRKWVRRAGIDGSVRPGLRTDERERLKRLERENFELRRANEILRSASLFFATELDGRHKT
jgi:transposase